MKLAVGIDIGGTVTKIGLVSENGNCIKKTSFRTKEINNFSDYIHELHNSIESITDDLNSICGIGIGAPNASKNGFENGSQTLRAIFKGIIRQRSG